jgi:hypothetical protein
MSLSRPLSLVPLLLALALVIAPTVGRAVLLASMTVLAPDRDQYVPTLDALTIPDDWETVRTEVVDYVEHLWINLDRRGSSFTIGTGDQRKTVRDPQRALIRITVDAVQRDQFEPTLDSPIPVR